MMLCQQGLATAMVRGMAHTTCATVSGVNASNSTAVGGGTQPSRSRWLLQQAALYCCISCILDNSVMDIERDRHESSRQPRLETLRNSEINLKQFRKVGLEDVKTWMECRLACMRSGIPNLVATELASAWAQQLDPSLGDLDERIADIEATNLAQHYTRTHMPRLGNMTKMQPEGVFWLVGGQMNSALSTNAPLRKRGDIVQLCKEFEIQGGLLSEVGMSWSTFPQSANLALWIR
jgi:hypothetical protein